MCLGLPLRVVESNELFALVEGRGLRRRVSLALVGPQPVGTPLLVHLETAVRVLEPWELPLLEQALDGLDAALNGENVDKYFPDLAGREPQLPPHLRREGGK